MLQMILALNLIPYLLHVLSNSSGNIEQSSSLHGWYGGYSYLGLGMQQGEGKKSVRRFTDLNIVSRWKV